MSIENNYDKALEQLENSSATPQESETLKVTSLGKARDYQNFENDEPALLPGYVEIWPSNFPSKGLFYNPDLRFFIRAAEVKEIRHFSTINEKNAFSIDESLNEIVKSCLMLRLPGKQMSFKDLKEEDRIFIIMAIRDLTFAKGENNLVLKPVCRECNHENELKIDNNTFERNELEEKILKYYSEESRIFEVQTKSSGIIKISPPSVGIMMEITKYIRNQTEEGKKIDPAFIKILPYMIQDWRGFNESVIKNLEVDFMTWNSTKYQTMNALIDLCRIGVKENLKMECVKCGSEVSTPITFPGGIKSLFVISDISGELL